jgi:hypothetical protein
MGKVLTTELCKHQHFMPVLVGAPFSVPESPPPHADDITSETRAMELDLKKRRANIL